MNLRPLNDTEVIKLAIKRRQKALVEYFKFNLHEVKVDKAFKKSMNGVGQFYKLHEDLCHFPSIASALLKYKKHEWVMIGFEKERMIDLVWINKGQNNQSVTMSLSPDELIHYIDRNNYSSILIFHNHPNSNPSRCTCHEPSPQDVSSAKHYAEIINLHGANLLEFVCERGRAYQYYESFAEVFFPVASYQDEVESQNGSSVIDNLRLHFEEMFS
jgi:hypothetical protein